VRRYSERFQTPEAVEQYEHGEYAPNSYSTYIWQLQKPMLQHIVESRKESYGPVHLLDFACGSGRVLQFLEDGLERSDGVDVSRAMAEVARARCRRSTIYVGDILMDPELVADDYDIVTCFRFILNTEHDNRLRVLRELHKRLAGTNGLLVANVHGNRLSARHLALLGRRMFRKERHSEMSRKAIRELFDQCGFDIVLEHGYGILPATLYRTRLDRLARYIDRMCSRIPALTGISIDLLYVCRPKT